MCLTARWPIVKIFFHFALLLILFLRTHSVSHTQHKHKYKRQTATNGGCAELDTFKIAGTLRLGQAPRWQFERCVIMNISDAIVVPLGLLLAVAQWVSRTQVADGAHGRCQVAASKVDRRNSRESLWEVTECKRRKVQIVNCWKCEDLVWVRQLASDKRQCIWSDDDCMKSLHWRLYIWESRESRESKRSILRSTLWFLVWRFPEGSMIKQQLVWP